MSGQPNKIMQCAAWALRMLSTMLLFWEAGTWELTAVDSARSEAFLLLVMLSTYCLTFFAFALLGVCGSKKTEQCLSGNILIGFPACCGCIFVLAARDS